MQIRSKPRRAFVANGFTSWKDGGDKATKEVKAMNTEIVDMITAFKKGQAQDRIIWTTVKVNTSLEKPNNRYEATDISIDVQAPIFVVSQGQAELDAVAQNLIAFAVAGVIVHIDSQVYSGLKQLYTAKQTQSSTQGLKSHNAKLGVNWGNTVRMYTPSITKQFQESVYIGALTEAAEMLAKHHGQLGSPWGAHLTKQVENRFVISKNSVKPQFPEPLQRFHFGNHDKPQIVQGFGDTAQMMRMLQDIRAGQMTQERADPEEMQDLINQMHQLEQLYDKTKLENQNLSQQLQTGVMINAGDMVNAFQRLPAIIDTIVKHHDDNPAQDYLSTLADPHGTLGKGFKIPSLSGIKTTTGYNYQTCDFTMRGENAIVIYNPNVIRGSPYIVMNHQELSPFTDGPAAPVQYARGQLDGEVQGETVYEVAFKTGLNAQQFRSSMALGTSIPWLSKMNEVRLVSSELTIHKTSKADKEGGLLRIAQSGMGGFKVNQALAQIVDNNPGSKNVMKHYIAASTANNGRMGRCLYRPESLDDTTEFSPVEGRVIGGLRGQFAQARLPQRGNNPFDGETGAYQGPIETWIQDDAGNWDDFELAEQLGDNEVGIAAKSLARDHVTVIMLNGLEPGTQLSLNMSRNFEGTPSNTCDQQVDSCILPLKYSNAIDILRQERLQNKGQPDLSHFSNDVSGFGDFLSSIPVVQDVANIGRSIWSLFTGKSSIKETFRKSAGSIAHAIVSNVPGLSGFAGAAKSAVDGIAGVSGFHHDQLQIEWKDESLESLSEGQNSA